MSFLGELLISALIVLGGVFMLVGSWGLVRLPELMTRLHAPTKATTLGVGGTLIGSMLYFFATEGDLSIHELLISLFLFLSAPITAHFVAKAYLHRHLDPAQQLPRPGKHGWSTFELPPDGPQVTERAEGESAEPPRG